MKTDSTTFDDSIAQWLQEQSMPWSRLKYKLTRSNLARHLGSQNLRVLDAGGGNGMDSFPLAEQGHRVDIVDYSKQMLAEAEKRAAQAGMAGGVALHYADLGAVPNLFKGWEFDLVLCHNVVSYVDDVPALLRNLVALLKAGGLISVIGVNRYSIPYHAAFMRGDLADALDKLDARSAKAYIFDTTFTALSAAEVGEMLCGAGCHVEQDYGIRCMCDYWGDTVRKLQPEVFEQIERLEFALTDRHPYKLLARYYQVVARKV
jgi:S-adenosylmethionine-dependent methyltransferase